ncbi:hypothetical protein DB347_19060 [Opitutaceae bacterium EW11]|nr:hypothetical protein DB347_19060 [Opitutaceae bacterium EW11]
MRVGSRRAPSAPFPGLLSSAQFAALAAEYRRACGFEICACDSDGKLRRGGAERPSEGRSVSDLRKHAVSEALRWGEPSVLSDGIEGVLWAIPVCQNQKLLGGLVVTVTRLRRPSKAGALDQRVVSACRVLLELGTRYNLVNAPLLSERRETARREQEKAEALHLMKEGTFDTIRSIYLREEPALIAAIRRGERSAARHAINRVLTAIYMLGQSRIELLKSLALELVVTMTRTAVQAGGNPENILGLNYQSLSRLADISDQEDLAGWLCRMLESLIDAIESNSRLPGSSQLARAVKYVEEHLAEALPREEVARAAGLSPSHFSHLMKARMGCTFTQLLTRMRLERARSLLVHTDAELAHVAAACGFTDQSYFTRVFRKTHRLTPSEFRRAKRPIRNASAPKSQTSARLYKPGAAVRC